MSRGGIETNCLTHILESNDTSNDDAESIHFNILTQSPYVSIDNVASFCNDNNFNVMSFNCRSLNACIDNLRNSIQLFKNKGYIIHIIALQETWLTDNNVHLSSLKIDGYNFVFAPCSLSRHSGVAFYIHTDFAYNIVNEVCDNTTFESLTINVQLSTENLVISNVYRVRILVNY